MSGMARMAKRNAVFAALAIFAALTFWSVWTPADAQMGPRLREISIEGTQRIEMETVKSYLSLSAGDPYDAERADKSLRTLYATGLFSDVTIRLEGDRLIVRVVENPIINRLSFEGLKKLKLDQIKPEMQLRERTVYSRTKVQGDVKRLLDMYRRSGRFAATVEPKIIQLDQNRVDVVFEINEGPGTYVDRINFVGNKAYSESMLQENIQTREERWYRFLTSDDTYDPDRMNYDREMLRRFYMRHGYADFRVSSAVAELTPDRESFFLTFTLDEGARYKFGKSVIVSKLKGFDAKTLQSLLTSKKGDWYNADDVEKIVNNITDALGTRGFAFVDVRPQVKRDTQHRVVDITYEINDGPKVYVDRIEIIGNVRTLDKVIRREFALVEGDAFNTARLRKTQQRLKDLNFFDKAEVTNVPSETAPDRTVIKAEVQEKSTGELSFGVGWSTIAGPLINVSMTEHNFLGRGQELSASGGIGFLMNNVTLSFTDPYFMDRPLSAGTDLFMLDQNLQVQAGYDYQSLGTSLRTGYTLADNLYQNWKYTLKQDTVKDIVDGASVYVLEQAGSTVLSSVQESLAYDRRDSRVDTTEGYLLRLTDEVAGIAGDEYFTRNTVNVSYYYPLADQVVLTTTGNAGLLTRFNTRPTRITERYFLGGDTLRGFAYYGVGPRDNNTTAALGGLWEAYGSTQVRFPLGLPKDFGITGEIFTDIGSIGETDSPPISGSTIQQATTLRASSGVGLAWKSPMGPIAVDLGFPWMKQPFDQKQIFLFNFGSRF